MRMCGVIVELQPEYDHQHDLTVESCDPVCLQSALQGSVQDPWIQASVAPLDHVCDFPFRCGPELA